MRIGEVEVSKIYVGTHTVQRIYVGEVLVWPTTQVDDEPVCFTAEQANSTIMVRKQGTSAPALTLVTSTDGETWTPYTVGTTITLANVGDKVYFAAGEGGNTTWATQSYSNYNMFRGTGRYSASGNIMTLLDKDDPPTAITTANCFANLFNGNTALTAAPRLPASTLANACYYQMFYGCNALRVAPELPAVTLTTSCYYYMFRGCTSLTTAPTLPATTLASTCYRSMF